MMTAMIAQNTQSTKYALRFSRVQKTWLILTANSAGDVIDKERAGRSKLNATLEILSRLNPHLHNLIIETAGQELDPTKAAAQLIKAASLILNGNVFEGEVMSQSDPNTFYHVEFAGTPKNYSCTCTHFRRGGNRSWDFGKMCKHTWAAHLAWRLGIALTTRPIAIQETN